MNKNSPLTIALLVPVFNGAKYISGFHQSLLSVDGKFDEIIFYDDNSSDDSCDLLQKLGYEVIRSDINRGPAFARNALLQQCSSDWIHFHDIDDLFFPNYIKETIKLVEANCDAVICDAHWLNAYNNEIVIKWVYKNQLLNSEGPAYLLKNPIGGINGL